MGKHWNFTQAGVYANVYSPTLHDNKVDGFKIQREIYKEFFELERELKKEFVGWISWTGIENPHIMMFCAKAGARPFEIDIKNKRIWFYKKF